MAIGPARYALLFLLMMGCAFGQSTLQPGQSMTVTGSLLPPSPTLSLKEKAAVRQLPVRPATAKECDALFAGIPCRHGRYTLYACPLGYALLNQWNGIFASSIPDGEATMEDVWDETPRPLNQCQNVMDWKDAIKKHSMQAKKEN
jgi:hypothetical protein